MFFNFSKSKFVAAYTRCNKYAWLDKNKPKEKAEPGEFVESLFDNGHKVGKLAKQYFNVDVDATILKENGEPNNSAMIAETQKQIAAGAKTIAEASFRFGGFFCSVDILEKNDDGTYNIYEVKSSKIESKKIRGILRV
jgi:RecB family endonuclease NucS